MLGVLERKCRLDKERNIQFYQNWRRKGCKAGLDGAVSCCGGKCC